MKVSFNGFNQAVASFSGNVRVGDIVMLTGNATVQKATASKDIHGVCVSYNGDVVGIQLRGAVTLAYSGTAPTVGYCILQTAGANEIKTATTGQAYFVLAVDTATQTATILL